MAEQVNKTNLVSVTHVSKRYGHDTVLNNINLEVESGECVVLVGHNGAGKTSLMKLMLGLSRPSEGSLQVLGYDPASDDVVKQHRSIGYLPESVAFYEAMTGREVLSFYARLKNVEKSECVRLLEQVGIEQAADRRVKTYSKGMRQRLGLAQAMLAHPRLLFLDEPTTGLDPLLRQQFYQFIDTMHQQGTTSIISSHALNEVEARASRFVIMRAGNIVASGTLDELYKQASLPVKLQLRVSPGKASSVAQRFTSDIDIAHINNEYIYLSCLNEDKMNLIRHITNMGDIVTDMQIIQPRLDEVYSYFMQEASS